ncbi:hypothetical protein D3C71_1642340 [compost metagenome]
MLEQILRPFALQFAKAQGIQDGDRSCAHRENIADNPAHARRRALVRLNGGWMVMALDFEHNSLVVADIYNTRAFARSHEDLRSADREPLQQRLRVLVGAVLGPHYAEHADFRIVRKASHESADQLVFAVRHAELAVNLLILNLLRSRFLNGHLLCHANPSRSSKLR